VAIVLSSLSRLLVGGAASLFWPAFGYGIAFGALFPLPVARRSAARECPFHCPALIARITPPPGGILRNRLNASSIAPDILDFSFGCSLDGRMLVACRKYFPLTKSSGRIMY